MSGWSVHTHGNPAERLRPMHIPFLEGREMRALRRIHVPAAVFLLSIASVDRGASATLSSYDSPPTPVRHAIHRLSQYTGIPVGTAAGAEPSIRIMLNATQNPKTDNQG